MAIEVHAGIWIGAEDECELPDATPSRPQAPWQRVVHACKYPCHARLLKYTYGGNVDGLKRLQEHPEYLVARRPGHLILNMIDPDVPLFRLESFTAALDFLAEQEREGVATLIHCNKGLSRAPSLALCYLAKRLRVLPDDSYVAARNAFRMLYRAYEPGLGIVAFLTMRWKEIA